MNVYDSARMADVVAPLGYCPTETPDDADLVIINTCHIREKAAEKTYSELGRLRQLQDRKAENGGRMLLAVAGCVAQAEGEEIMRRAPYVDMVFGPQAYHRLPEMIARIHREADRKDGATSRRRGVLDTDFPVEPKFDHLPVSAKQQALTAFLTVQEGCDKFCTFCVVPYTRGAEYSRDAAAIIAEAQNLVDNGAVEITLLGQNVNAYHGVGPDGRDWSLARLIQALAEIDGLARIRYTTSHPRDMRDDLYAAHRDCEKLMPYLHLPAQAGADRILRAMNRHYSRAEYIEAIARLREARPDIALSGDFIVGFPGESDGEFEQTLDLVRQVGYAQAYSFKYSSRPGTPAADLALQIPETVKAERLDALQELLNHQQVTFNRDTEGRIMPVLLEREGRRPGQLVGRSPYMQAVHIEAPSLRLGTFADVRIIAGQANSLAGELAESGTESADAGTGDSATIAAA
jgi:tRNA-2-methylthio-N6-dimethylallyladenosine synthase